MATNKYTRGSQKFENPHDNCETEMPQSIIDLKDLKPNGKEEINFVSFTKLPEPGNNETVLAEWMKRTSIIGKDLQYLLTFSHLQFWCHAVFDDSLHDCITSFLRLAPRPHFFRNNTVSKEVEERLKSLSKLFFLVCLRMSTNIENESQIIPGHEFGEILYDNFIFDMPKLFDLCAIYLQSKRVEVESIVSNIFTHQPKYFDDLRCFANTLPAILDSICERFGSFSRSNVLKKLTQNTDRGLSDLSDNALEETINFVYDTFYSINSLFEIFPPSAKECDCESLLAHLSYFYETFCTRVCEVINKSCEASEKLKNSFCRTQFVMLSVFRQIIYQSTLSCIFENQSNLEEMIEVYILLLQSILNEKRFLADYFYFFPVQEDIDLIEQSGYKIDELRFNYIEDAITEAVCQHTPVVIKKLAFAEPYNNLPVQEHESLLGACQGVGIGSKNISVTDEMIFKISSVQELLPHLGSGFIKCCLDSFDGNVEAVINAVFEDRLPPSLSNLDRSFRLESDNMIGDGFDTCATIQSSDAEDLPGTSILSERRNIFDGDEFDAFRHDVDMSRIHLGKKSASPVAKLTDGSMKEKIKYLSELPSDDEYEARTYSDEYDDTYDACVPDKVDPDSDGSANNNSLTFNSSRRPFKAEGNNNNDEANRNNFRNPANFLEDPAVLRERAAQQRAAKYAAKSNHARRNNHHHNQEGGAGSTDYHPPSRDVKGGVKGQGQSEEVLRNRNFKEKNKSSRVNHNRRDLAARKHAF